MNLVRLLKSTASTKSVTRNMGIPQYGKQRVKYSTFFHSLHLLMEEFSASTEVLVLKFVPSIRSALSLALKKSLMKVLSVTWYGVILKRWRHGL